MPCKNPKEELQNLSQQNPMKKHRRKAQRRYKEKKCMVCWGWEQQKIQRKMTGEKNPNQAIIHNRRIGSMANKGEKRK
jgi:hypothetical protein